MPELIQPDWPAPGAVRAFTTTRRGGVSQGVWHSLNLGAHCGDDAGAVRRNRQQLRSLLPAEPLWLDQVHGSQVVEHAGGQDRQPTADGAVARQPGQVCAVLTADCLPVLLCDTRGRCVAAAHAGWRGLAAGILESTVEAMCVAPERVMAWLGPGIGPRAYEVGAEVREAFVRGDAGAAKAFAPHGDRWLADLYLLARRRLEGTGIVQVFGGGLCTHDEPRRFFSHRRDGQTGRMATVIWLE
ncbi:MAG: peptidoglycan editing factor PgeF [Xanthomonadales bacterium]|nr:peptidoglycan editing factor PgeF [Xanthomonadales bacterium]NIX13629.1 peptidoglycan editing factor PgeF [Xanthomonadales bacterium]